MLRGVKLTSLMHMMLTHKQTATNPLLIGETLCIACPHRLAL